MKRLIKKILKEELSKEEKLIKIITKSNKSVISDLGGAKEIKKLFGNYDFYTSEFLEKLINNELSDLREESEDWGLGEMDELDEINSVEKIKVVNLVKVSKIKVYVDIYTYPDTDRDDFGNLRAEIQYRLEGEWNPKIQIYINDIKKSDAINELKLDELAFKNKKKLIENKDYLMSALRRVNFTEDDIKNYLKKFSLRFLDKTEGISKYFVEKVCNFTAYELIEPGLLHMSDEDADKAVNEMMEKLKDKYSDLIEDYVNDLIFADDDETYCFKKHSDRNMDMLKNRGFGDCVKGWVNFMSEYGSWFPDLDWNEIKEKISSNPNKYLLIKNPLENHPYEYYFSVLKVIK